MIQELTIELTDWCPHGCPYCSSDSTRHWNDAVFISVDTVSDLLSKNVYSRINLSGGEPLAHPSFYEILERCKQHVSDVNGIVWLYTNALQGIMYNQGVIDGVRVHANVTILDNVEEVHILKRTDQGREKTRPGIKFSKNWDCDCDQSCNHVYVRPTGDITKSPCAKWESR